MDQEVVDFIKSKILSTDYVDGGTITTTAKISFNTGAILSGTSVTDLSTYNKEEAQKSAYDNAIATLLPGVALILNKQP